MSQFITASVLYDFVQCPHRLSMDLFGDPVLKDPINPFIQLLWERGNAFEQEVIKGLNIPFENLKFYPAEQKENLTLEAMKTGAPLIYGGRLRADDLVGEPDILRRAETGYIPVDIKSGAGEEGGSEDEDGKPKKHYAVQVALYTDVLERLRLSGGRIPFIWDVHGREVVYDLDAPQGARNPTTLWQDYQGILNSSRRIITKIDTTLAAYASSCKLCHWYTACKKKLEHDDDLSLIPELGRAKRDTMILRINCRSDLVSSDINSFIQGRKTIFPGIGPDTLLKFHARAKLQKQANPVPYLKNKLDLPSSDRELFFDVETDPMRDICYLHGFIERESGKEKYVAFFADNPDESSEKKAFEDALNYIQAKSPCVIYYYSPYERTTFRKLQKKYSLVSDDHIESLFDVKSAVDLYNHVVRPNTEWPTYDHSIKSLASHLGFSWRDPNPSGAASIEWYHRWTESKDPAIKKRILEYNEDDCVAMRVLLNGIRKMKVI